MKKSLCLLALCLSMLGTYAQDDDVYFVPSSKNKKSQPQRTEQQAFPEGRSTYTPIEQDATFEESNWADGRVNGTWDVDAYNRRGKHYRGECADTATAKSCYDQGYADGYEDGSYTARIVRFWSPRPGVYVSSPYYMDYYDLCYYDPWYYGYGAGWSWGWSGWYGWGSWYGWRPYYSWGWGWGPSWGWYDPWWGHHWHGHYHHHHWYPATADRGPRGGWIDYGGRRGTNNSFAGRGTVSSRPSRSMDFNRGTTNRRSTNFGGVSGSGSRSTGRPSSNFGTGSRPGTGTQRNTSAPRREQSTSRPSRSFDNRNSSGSSNRSSSFSAPSRSSGSSFGGGGRSSGGGSRSFGGGGGRGRR